MTAQWVEEQKMREIMERRRIEGETFKLEVLQQVPELVVHDQDGLSKR